MSDPVLEATAPQSPGESAGPRYPDVKVQLSGEDVKAHTVTETTLVLVQP